MEKIISLHSNVNKSDISYLKKLSWVFEYSNPLKSSLGSHSQSVSAPVGITSSSSLLAFLLSVVFPFSFSLVSSCLICLYFLVSQTHNCARVLIVATPVLKATV